MKSNDPNRGHLTAEEVSRWLVEGPEDSASRHAQECAACKAELAEARAPLAAFRAVVVDWSEAQAARPIRLRAPEIGNEKGLWFWLPAAAFGLAVLLMFGYSRVSGLWHGPSSAGSAIAAVPKASDSDEALLAQVDTEVSESVPDAMAPLTDLVAWDSTEAPSTKAATTAKPLGRKAASKPASAKAAARAEN